MTLKGDKKFDKKLTCGLENDIKVSKLGYSWDPLMMGSVMTMKNDVKLEEELTCHFKTDMTNLTNFDSSTRKSKKKSFLIGSKVYNV